MNAIARWLFRRFVGPRIVGYIFAPVHGLSSYPGEVLAPDDVEVVFRD